MGDKIAKIQTNLWFNDQAEEAVRFYTSIFKNSGLGRSSYYLNSGQDMHGKPAGSVMAIEFHLEGQEFVALNGGPGFKFTEAISIIVNCETQEELDYYWEKLSEGGDKEAQNCGWLKDKFGVSWQIVPSELYDMILDPDTEKSERVMDAMLKMEKKLDIHILRQAYHGE
jgi:predicted 3-demethylubiquinone-9 3-methyltransferase (glyoxalase superfamily)